MVLTRLQELEGFVHRILLFTVCTRNCPNTLASTTTLSGAHSGSLTTIMIVLKTIMTVNTIMIVLKLLYTIQLITTLSM